MVEDIQCGVCGEGLGAPAPLRDVSVVTAKPLFVAIGFRLPGTASGDIPAICEPCQVAAIREAAKAWPPGVVTS